MEKIELFHCVNFNRVHIHQICKIQPYVPHPKYQYQLIYCRHIK